jgi:cell division septation protein DedD
MPRNEDGEFELILGNRQLLSVFLIVVVLLGIFFAMGYIVARYSYPEAVETARRDSSSQSPIVVDPIQQTAKTESKPSPQPTAPEVKPTEEPASRAPEAAKRETTPPPKSTEASRAESVSSEGASYGDPPAGNTYIQVAAVGKTDAELTVTTLRKRGFPALVANGPPETPGIFRVLVGPLGDPASVARTRADLQNAGFKGAYVRRY